MVQSNSDTKIEYAYDGHNRVTQIKRFKKVSGVYQEDTAQRTDLFWDYSAGFGENVNVQGRLAGVQTYQGGTWKESFNYTAGGLMTKKKMQLTIPGVGGGRTLESNYEYNNEGQMKSMTYPSTSSGAGRTLTYGFDAMARPVSMTDNQGEVNVWGVVYNHRSQITSLTNPVGQVVNWGFNELGQLTSMSTSGLTETYAYSPGANNGRIVKKVTNGEEVVYQYDALNRLIRSTAESWEETYITRTMGSVT